MPSKGITVYSYISVDGYEVEFAVPDKAFRNTPRDNFTSKNLEMESSDLQGYTGRFEWLVHDPSGVVVGTRFNLINSLTGNLEGGNMTSTVPKATTLSTDAIGNRLNRSSQAVGRI